LANFLYFIIWTSKKQIKRVKYYEKSRQTTLQNTKKLYQLQKSAFFHSHERKDFGKLDFHKKKTKETLKEKAK